MAGQKRLHKELLSMNESPVKEIFKMDPIQNDNIYTWSGLLLPNSPPYDKGAFKVQIDFCPEYPFKPPTVIFKTPIYHPNVDEKGQICFPLILPDNWKPATKTADVIQVLHALVINPEIEHPLRADLAEEYSKNKATFNKNAEAHTLKNAIRR